MGAHIQYVQHIDSLMVPNDEHGMEHNQTWNKYLSGHVINIIFSAPAQIDKYHECLNQH